MEDFSPDRATGHRRPLGFVVPMLACLMIPALLQAAAELGRSGRVEVLRDLWSLASARLVPGVGSVSAAPTLAAIERRLEADSLVVRWARRFYAPAVDGVLKRGNPKVVFGRRNWLFYRQAVDYVTGPPIGSTAARRLLTLPRDLGEPAAAIIDFQRQLQRAGVELLVVPVPVKLTLHPERLWAGADPFSMPNNRGFAGFVAELEAAGVRVLDLAPPLLEAKRGGMSLFLSRDTHWTPPAMALAAQSVATAVRGLPLWAALEPASEPFDHRLVAFEGGGDLHAMLAYAPYEAPRRPLRFVVEQVIATSRGRGPRDQDSPILLLGDSFTNVFSSGELGLGQRGGLGEQLASQLGLPIDVIALPAGGASRSRKALALRPRPLRGKRLVIWQFTQRDLLFATEGWTPTPLTETAEPAAASAVPERRYEVLAWLEKTTGLPQPMDYADCLIVSRYRKVDGDLPGSRTIDVLRWGVRDGKPTAAARYRPKAVHRLVLSPLPQAIDLERSCWLDAVGIGSRPWWVVRVEPQ